MTTVLYDDLLLAFEWANTDGFDTEAYVSLEDGTLHHSPLDDESGPQLPEDVEDESKYLKVPSRGELGLGREMVFQFAKELMPEAFEEIANFFRYKGAYRRFKDFLARQENLEAWHQFEAKTTEEALRQWCAEHDLLVKP